MKPSVGVLEFGQEQECSSRRHHSYRLGDLAQIARAPQMRGDSNLDGSLMFYRGRPRSRLPVVGEELNVCGTCA